MPDLETFTGAYGYDIVLNSGIDLASAEIVKLKIRTPAGNTLDRPIVPEKREGNQISYTVASNDFTSAGLYKLQVFDETKGRKVAGTVHKVRVRPSIEYVER